MKERYYKLMQTMRGPKKEEQFFDEGAKQKVKKETELARIDAKISELENSDDPNVAESLDFWRKKRKELSAD